jgi:hypothetical protein
MSRKKKLKKTKINRVNRLKQHYILSIRDAEGNVIDTVSRTDYDILLMEGMERAKDINGFWEVFNSLGKRIDGSFDGIRK